ncbi:MAG: hydrogenase maturation protease [Chloroflexota bacterium]
MSKVTVIGIGQSLRGDDAAGLEAVRRWREQFNETAGRPEVQVEVCELPGLGLLDLFEGADAVLLVDAVHSGAGAGSIHRVGPGDLAAFTAEANSAHGWGVAETLGLARQLGLSLPRIHLIGIEAEQMEIGAGLSPAVEAALPAVCLEIERLLQVALEA